MHRITIVALSALVLLPVAAQAQSKSSKELKTVKVETAPAAAAAGAALTVRGTAALGFYDGNADVVSDGGAGFGLGTGANFTFGRWFADLGLDYYDVAQGLEGANEFARTDVLLTGGARITDWISAFGGFRNAWQGDSGVFNDDMWTETGFFAGAGVAFPVGEGDLRSGLSLAYNLNKLEFTGGGGDYDYNGLSGKIRVSLARTPHAVELRFQTFKASEDAFYLRETYAFLYYVFSWRALEF